MSRWLSSVAGYLEQLDGQVETAVEEHVIRQEEEAVDGDKPTAGGKNSVEDILFRRGLSATASADDEDEFNHHQQQKEEFPEGQDKISGEQGEILSESFNQGEQIAADPKVIEASNDGEVDAPDGQDAFPDIEAPPDPPLQSSEIQSQPESESQLKNLKDSTDQDDPARTEAANDGGEDLGQNDELEEKGTETEQQSSSDDDQQKPKAPVEPDPAAAGATKEKNEVSPSPAMSSEVLAAAPPLKQAKVQPTVAKSAAPKMVSAASNKKELAEAREAQKEARTLRRHVVSLNAQLEAAENEVQAQREELESAAKLMEKERQKHKETIEKLKVTHGEAIRLLKAEQENSLKENQAKFQAQLMDVRDKLAKAEDRRQQEGGDWNKELAQAREREEQMTHSVAMLEEEKSTLLSQISTLQDQQAALGSRLESLTETAEGAMARERDAEDKLDAALSLHAHQISQRQARERELERTIQELGTALVVAKNRASGGGDGASSLPDDVSSLRARVNALECDLETANAHLKLERERSQALHQELREMSKESSEEASSVLAKQAQSDRQIADLSLTIAKLQATLRDAQKESFNETESIESRREDDSSKKISMLSEEVIRLRDKIGNQNSELLTMRNRVKSAMERASSAEEKLTAMSTNGNGAYDSMERGSPSSGNGLTRRRNATGPPHASIRSMMRLNPGQGEQREKLGQAIDVVDSFVVSTARYIRQNPVARAGFLLYLLLIHAWAFFLLFFHAHQMDSAHSELWDGGSHGLHAVVQQQQQQVQPLHAKESQP